MSDITVKVALVVLNLTIVVPVKPEPVRSMPTPIEPLVGEKLVILGAKLKLIVLVVVPVGVVTLISPPVAPVGTVVLIAVSEATVKVALTPLNLTAVAPVKLAPSMVTDVPTIPLVGKKLLILGLTAKLLVLVAVPIGVVTLTMPVIAPFGTVVVIAVSEPTLNVAFTPLNLTLVAPVKLAPVIVTFVPTAPLVGEKLVIVGGKVTVKLLLLMAVAIGVVTWICPVVAPVGTVVVMEVSDVTEKVEATLLNLTAVAPVKLAPVIVTAVPIIPLVGEKLVMVGGKLTVKLLVLVAVPTSVVMLIMPVVAPVGTMAVKEVSDTTLNVVLTPLKLTVVVPVKLAPVIVTDVPTVPLVGEKLVIVGLTPKLLVLVAVLSGVVTLIAPVVAPVGTVVVMAVSETTLNVALAPLKLTLVAPVKFAPVIVTLVPTVPLIGKKLVIVGGKVTVKLLVLVAVPSGVVTLICPVVAPVGTVAFIEVSETILKVVLTPLNLTIVAPVKLAPTIFTLAPIVPLVGEKLAIIVGVVVSLLANAS